jgi:flagellar hook-length control protein FliK
MNISMNSATVTPAAAADTALPNVAGASALPQDAAQAAQAGLLPQAAVPAPFQQWLGLDPALLALEAAPATEPAADAAPAEAETETAATEADTAAAGEPLLAAMSMTMPMMQAALPAMMMAMPAVARPQASGNGAAPAQGDSAAALPAAGAIELPETLSALPLPAVDSPALQLARQAASVQPVQMAQSAQAGNSQSAAATAAPATADAMATLPADTLGAGFGVSAPTAPTTTSKGGDTVTLAGPPTAWRQTLQEALGDRLQFASSRNVDQAVIRLDPPNLGRIEISIRHAAGSLEVNISATHGEVLRQLSTVSENLRSDLAQRQFSEVSVNVTQAARAQGGAQAGAQAFGGDAQGRRQQDQEQERTPGHALFEAGKPDTLFSLNGRE